MNATPLTNRNKLLQVSPVQLILLGLFQSLLYHTNRFLTDISLGGTDDMGGATVIHVFGALYVQSSFPL